MGVPLSFQEIFIFKFTEANMFNEESQDEELVKHTTNVILQ